MPRAHVLTILSPDADSCPLVPTVRDLSFLQVRESHLQCHAVSSNPVSSVIQASRDAQKMGTPGSYIRGDARIQPFRQRQGYTLQFDEANEQTSPPQVTKS